MKLNFKQKPTKGRPPINDKPMKLHSFYLTDEQKAWLNNQFSSKSKTIRDLIDEAMKESKS